MRYIGDIEEINIQIAMKLAEYGIDIFNPKDEFFNNICHFYDIKEKKDIIIEDRRNDFYQNVTFCQDGCEYYGMDYELMVANCTCDINTFLIDEINNEIDNKKSKSEKLNFNTIKKSFISNLFDLNYKVIFCYNLIIKPQILKKILDFIVLLV